MRRVRLLVLALAVTTLAAALPRPSSAVMCPIFCWMQGDQTCWQAANCSQHCCTTGSLGCFSPCD